jgi:BCD family chlorophyll transporter-like MFS transporter
MNTLLLFFKRTTRQMQEWLDRHETVRRWLNILRLGLFQFGMGLSLAPLTGTLNRVLIDEMGISALAVGFLLAIHYFVSPVRAMIGFKSDKGRSVGRWRTPYVILGAMLTFGGLVCAPFTLLILSGDAIIPLSFWLGMGVSTLIFLAYGIGANIVETIYLALVSDITPPKERGKVLAVLWVMLVLGTVVSSIIISYLLENYSGQRLIQVMQGSATIFMLLTFLALWKQERLNPDGTVVSYTDETRIRLSFWESVRLLLQQKALRDLFIVLFIATTAFATHDVLLEPYGGQVLNMSVAETTQLTALWGMAMLVAITVSGWSLWKGHSPLTIIKVGCSVGALGFLVISLASNAEMVNPFRGGVWLIGMGRGTFIVASVALVMSLTDVGHAGLFIGLWGIMQAVAQGFGTIFGSLVRDIAYQLTNSVALGYVVVYVASLAFLLVSLGLIVALRLGSQLRADMLRSPWSGLQDVPADQIAF